jgi:hypothetical protein
MEYNDNNGKDNDNDDTNDKNNNDNDENQINKESSDNDYSTSHKIWMKNKHYRAAYESGKHGKNYDNSMSDEVLSDEDN